MTDVYGEAVNDTLYGWILDNGNWLQTFRKRCEEHHDEYTPYQLQDDINYDSNVYPRVEKVYMLLNYSDSRLKLSRGADRAFKWALDRLEGEVDGLNKRAKAYIEAGGASGAAATEYSKRRKRLAEILEIVMEEAVGAAYECDSEKILKMLRKLKNYMY